MATKKNGENKSTEHEVLKSISLHAKLLHIMNGAGAIEKLGFNSTHKYSFVREADIVAKVRELMIEQGVIMVPSIKASDVVQRGEKSTLTNVIMEITFYDALNPTDYITTTWAGTGLDSGDKGIYKAITGAMKYALMKTFMIETYDDAENDDDQKPRTESKADTKPTPKPVEKTKDEKARAAFFATFNQALAGDGINWKGENYHKMSNEERREYMSEVLKRNIKSATELTAKDFVECLGYISSGRDPHTVEEEE